MRDPAEGAAVAEKFGVSDEQVRRDHLLSHLLAVLARDLPDAVVFFGGTAFARTHLPEGRLSEDLDLFAVPRRRGRRRRRTAARDGGTPRVRPARLGPTAVGSSRRRPSGAAHARRADGAGAAS